MRERQAYRHRLDSLFEQIPDLTENHALQSQLVKFACILVCGYVEVALRDILQEYTSSNTASNELQRFVDEQLKRSPNPNMGAILGLVRTFSKDWAEDLRIMTQGRIREHVNSLVYNRNQIAHGQNENVVLSYSELREYYLSAQALVDLIEKQCGTH